MILLIGLHRIGMYYIKKIGFGKMKSPSHPSGNQQWFLQKPLFRPVRILNERFNNNSPANYC